MSAPDDSIAQAEAEVARTRARLERTVAELKARLAPSALLAEATEHVTQGASNLAQAGGDKLKAGGDKVKERPAAATGVTVGVLALVAAIVAWRERRPDEETTAHEALDAANTGADEADSAPLFREQSGEGALPPQTIETNTERVS